MMVYIHLSIFFFNGYILFSDVLFVFAGYVLRLFFIIDEQLAVVLAPSPRRPDCEIQQRV